VEETSRFSSAHRIVCLLFFSLLPLTPVKSLLTIANASSCSSSTYSFVGDGTNGTTSGFRYTVESITAVGTCEWTVPTNVDSVTVLVVV